MNRKNPLSHDEKPFDGMFINDSSFLDELEGRSPCTKCFKSRKYFCYSCYIPIQELEGRLPVLKLPIQIDIIKHKHEIDGKSTAIHGAILAPNHIKIYTYPHIPDYINEENVYLIYPSRTAVDIGSLFSNINEPTDMFNSDDKRTNGTLMTKRFNPVRSQSDMNKLDKLPITRAVFIDSTWNQSRGIYKDERIKNLPCVVIQNRISQFWRHQKGSPRWYLATIEAIHQFLLEIHVHMWGVNPEYKGQYCEDYGNINNVISNTSYCGQYDNILFFFSHMYKKIHSIYSHDQLQAYSRPLD